MQARQVFCKFQSELKQEWRTVGTHVQIHGQILMGGGASVVLVNVDLGQACLPGWFSLHPDLACQTFCAGPAVVKSTAYPVVLCVYFRRHVLEATENGGSVVFRCISWALLSGSWPHFLLTISNWLQNHLCVSPEPSQTFFLHPPMMELQVYCLVSWMEINSGLRYCSHTVFYSCRG